MLLDVVIVQQPLRSIFVQPKLDRHREAEEKCRKEACVVGVKCLETLVCIMVLKCFVFLYQ